MDADDAQDTSTQHTGMKVVVSPPTETDANSNDPPKPTPVKSVSAPSDDKSEKEANKEEIPNAPLDTLLVGTTSLSSHDRSKTVAAVAQIFEKGEQPKTDRNEIWAWYCYDWANSPFSGVVMALLLPLLLTDLAEEFACSKTKYGCDINAQDLETGEVIQVYMGPWELKATSYAAFMVGLASLIQAIFYVFVGPLADYGRYRTLLFRITAISGAICTCLYIVLGDKSLWQFAGWWCIITSVFYGLSIIFYNSWLPIIVETHPDVIKACADHVPEHKLTRIIEYKTDKLALCGFAWGYIGGMVVMIICLGILLMEPPVYVEGDEYGSVNKAFVAGTKQSFSEAWARDITSARINYTVAAQFVYMNGLQFSYDGIDGALHGVPFIGGEQRSFSFPNGVDRVQIYRSVAYNHICGIAFHPIGSDKDTYSSVGNTSAIRDVIVVDTLFEEDMVFGGISGSIAEVKEEQITEMYAIASLSLLFVHEAGQFRGGLSTLHERIGILLTGIWLLLFTLVSIKYLKDRPGPPLPEGEHVAVFGIKQTIITLRKAKQFPVLFMYLLAYFLFSDGVGSMISCGALFGRELLNMTNAQLAVMILEVYFIGTLGTFFFLKLEERYNIESKKMLCMHLAFLAVFPMWALIGLIPGSSVGMVSITEMYIWSFFMAIHIGSVQSFARSVFAQLIPVGHESEMFALYEITDKGSSWLGPLVVAIVSDVADMRWAMFYVMLFFLIPLPICWVMDMDKGRFEAGRSPMQVTQRASLLFDAAMVKELKEDLADIIEENREKETISNQHKQQALEMAIDENLTTTQEEQ